ncbi:MAG TPA: MFS transporter [Thermomicrobiales bacterium]|nr:MFS transporter [Thermomicrobiales bacterium]
MATVTLAVPRTEVRRWFTLAIVLGGTFMAFFDAFVVNVAVPTVQRDLRASFAEVQFVIAGYGLAYAVTLITGGRLGDIYGRKRLFLLGLAAFTACSALCGLAPTAALLVAARVAQGLAAALMAPQVLSVIQVTFPPAERSRALGVYGAVFGFAATAGQVLGGLIVRADLFGLTWRPVFLVNVPIGLATFAAAASLLAESRSATAPRLDLGGVGLLTLGLGLLAFPLIEGRNAGWPAWAPLGLLAAGPVLAAFVAFERRETRRGGAPLVVLRLFRQRPFAVGLATFLMSNAAGSGFMFTVALHLQFGLRFSPFAAGLVIGPAAVGYFIAATLSVRLAPRLGARLVVWGIALAIGVWVATIAVVVLYRESLPGPLLALVLFGAGFGNGLASPPLAAVVLAGVGRDDAGSASGMLVTAQQIGGALGVALIGVVLFGVLAGQAARVGADLAPEFGRQLAAAGLPADAVAPTIADFRDCAADRAATRDPAVVPASCRRPTLQPTTSPVAATVATFLQRANARDYATASAASYLATLGFQFVSLLGAVSLCVPRRAAGG